MPNSKMMQRAAKVKGDISSVFVNLGASSQALDPRLLQLKRQIAPANPSILQKAYDRLLNTFEKEGAEIRKHGSSILPEVDVADIKANGGRIPEKLVPIVKKRGAIVVRNIVDQAEAIDYKAKIQEYIKKHPEIIGFPADNPQVWEVYWSRSQVRARSHENFNAVAVAMNNLWHTNERMPIDLDTNLAYCDRLRIRLPQDGKFALGGHIDGGSLERWEDPEYRRCYTKIFEGNWEEYDPFDVTHRIEANMDLYNAPGGCSMFRIFQGWLAMSHIVPNGGTLRVCPLVKEPTAYFLMKPLLEQYLDQNDFLGAFPGRIQEITKELHPHIVDNMISVPEVNPGDGVFWHCDQVHAVESKNEMDHDSSVLYIPSTPLCRKNSEYLLRQRNTFILGESPPDFPANHSEKNLEDRAKPETLNEREKLGMGFAPVSYRPNLTAGQEMAIRQHNAMLSPFPQ